MKSLKQTKKLYNFYKDSLFRLEAGEEVSSNGCLEAEDINLSNIVALSLPDL